MDKLAAIIKKRKEAVKGEKIYLRADKEEQKRQEYEEKQKEVEKQEEIALGKRMKKLQEYYDFAKLKIKKSKPAQRITLKTEEQIKIESNVRVNDTTKRNVTELDFELVPENVTILNQHNEAFIARIKKAEEDRIRKYDPSKDMEYDEKCDDILWFVQKTMQEWEHWIAGQKTGWEKTLEGRKARDLFRETKRNFWSMFEVLINRVS